MDLILHNDAALTEILLRLPAKSLIRFKSVCKMWLALISSDYFCHQHTLRRPKLQHSLIIGTRQAWKFFYFNSENTMIPYSLRKPHHQIRKGCNGLLLLKSQRHQKKYYVYNPTTRQSRTITLAPSDKFPYVVGITLAFDPSKSPYYRLVCIRSTTLTNWGPYAYRFEVYDSESHTWKLGLEPSTCPRIYNGGVHWNNSIFWSVRGRDGFCYFDIAKSEIKNLHFPPDSSYRYLQESNGHLYCFRLVKGHQSVSVAVWELGGDDHSQWLSNHCGEIHPHSVEGFRRVRFVGGWGGDRATCRLLIFEESPPRMMAYNFLDKSYELLVDLTGQPVFEYGGVMKAFQFGETLALV